MANRIVEVGYGNVNRVKIGGNQSLAFIGGPCAIMARPIVFRIFNLNLDVFHG